MRSEQTEELSLPKLYVHPRDEKLKRCQNAGLLKAGWVLRGIDSYRSKPGADSAWMKLKPLPRQLLFAIFPVF